MVRMCSARSSWSVVRQRSTEVARGTDQRSRSAAPCKCVIEKQRQRVQRAPDTRPGHRISLSCSRCEQLPKTLLADAARERRAQAFLVRVAQFWAVNSSIHTRGRPLSKSTRNMFSNLYAMPTDVWATKKNAPARGRLRSTTCTSEVHFVLPGAQPQSVHLTPPML